MGQFAATTCQDAPQVVNMSWTPADRVAAFPDLLDAQQNSDPIFAPFTVQEWAAGPLDYTFLGLCQSWPTSRSSFPQNRPVASMALPNVPALVLTGDLDTITPVGQGNEAASDFYRPSRVIVPNAVHVVALDAYNDCLSAVVREFIFSARHFENSTNWWSLNTSCVDVAYPAIKMLTRFPHEVAQSEPARAADSTSPTSNQTVTPTFELQVAAVAAFAVADAFQAFWYGSPSLNQGLYGGSWRDNSPSTSTSIPSSGTSSTSSTGWEPTSTSSSLFPAAGYALALEGFKYTSDLAVSGDVTVYADLIAAYLTLEGVATGSVSVEWPIVPWQPLGQVDGVALIQGTINTLPISAYMRAP